MAEPTATGNTNTSQATNAQGVPNDANAAGRAIMQKLEAEAFERGKKEGLAAAEAAAKLEKDKLVSKPWFWALLTAIALVAIWYFFLR
ncbi:MAG: hypothetical protein QXR53_05085 [Candidatus Norongarragalinales archaeon]